MSAVHRSALFAVAKRQLASYLANPLGYIVILAFVVFSWYFLFVGEEFFERNIADLHVLYGWMPGMLVVLVSLLTMSAWTTEREQGTEELLLTLPVSIADAILGKYLAVLGFFTLALLCTVSLVAMIAHLGDPDLGLVLANYVAWWLLGATYAAFALLASVLVGNQVIAFVLGLVFAAGVWAGAWSVGWTEPFYRGIIPTWGVIGALGAAASGLGLAMLVLAARRWRSQLGEKIGLQLGAALLAIGCAANLAGIAERFGIDVDVSVEGLASLSEVGEEVIGDLEHEIKLDVFVTADRNLPKEYRLKAQEVLDRAKAMERISDGKVELEIHRPLEATDDVGRLAEGHYNLEAREVRIDTVAGSQRVQIFLGAVISSGSHERTVPFFESGLSVEYELVRAARTVSRLSASPETPAAKLTVVLPTDPPPPIANLVADVRDALGELGARDDVELEVVEVAGATGDGSERAASLGMELRELKAGAIETPGEQEEAGEADGDGGDDDPGESEEEEDDGADDDADAEEPRRVECYFGAVAESGGYRIDEAWLGDAYDASTRIGDMVADLEALHDKKLPILGVLETDLNMHAGMDMTSRQWREQWRILDELQKHYEVRTIAAGDLLAPTNQDVDVLLAPLPSSLVQNDMVALGDWIWHGRPALLLVDPLPFFSLIEGRNVAPEAPKMAPFQRPGTPPQPAEEQKGNVRRILSHLGIEIDPAMIGWSAYKPAPFRDHPPNTAFFQESAGCFYDHPVNQGMETVVAFYPGLFWKKLQTRLTVEPLVRYAPGSEWGSHPYSEHVVETPRGAFQKPVGAFESQEDSRATLFAAEVTGPFAYPFEEGELAEANVQSKAGAKVVVVADVDFTDDRFYQHYVMSGDIDPEDPAQLVLRSIRNIQFVSNCVDHLAGDTALPSLRARQPRHRTLELLDEFSEEKHAERIRTQERLQEKYEKEIESAETKFQEALDRETANLDPNLDEFARDQRIAQIREGLEKKLAKRRSQIDREKIAKFRELDREEREQIAAERNWVRVHAILWVSIFLLMLIGLVFLNRLVREATDIPASRKRSAK